MADDRKKGPSWVSRIGGALTSKPIVVGAAALAGAAVVGSGAEYIFGDSVSDQHDALSDILNKVQDGGWLGSDQADAVNVPAKSAIELTPPAAPGTETSIISFGDKAAAIGISGVDTGEISLTNDSKTTISSLLDSNAVKEAAEKNKELGDAISAFNSDLATDDKVSKDVFDTLMNKLGGIQGWNVNQFTVDNPPPGYFGYTAPDSPDMKQYAGKQFLFHDDLAKAFEGKNDDVVEFLNYASSPVHTSGLVGGAVGGIAAGSAAAGMKDESNRRAVQQLREDPNFWRAQIADEMAARDQSSPVRGA